MGISSSKVREDNFEFAFNNLDFSDRILRLEVTPDDNGKKLRGEKYNDWFSCIGREDSNCKAYSDGAKVTTLNISSPILAANSPVFYKMFNKGISELQQKSEICLQVNSSEEAALMDLLKFMYGNYDVTASSSAHLVDLLIAADKFEVTSCMDHCAEMLLFSHMTLESALLYLELPSSVLERKMVKPLLEAAKQFVFDHYMYSSKSQFEVIQLPLSTIEAVLQSVDLQVVSEDNIFDFVLKWARGSYPELEVRREILTKRLAQLICFQNMSLAKLKEVEACTEFDHQQVSKLVIRALFSKVAKLCLQLPSNSKALSTIVFDSAGRGCSPQRAGLFPFGKLDSPQFCVGGKLVYLSARCGHEKDQFGLFVRRMPYQSKPFVLDFALEVMKKSLMGFETKFKVENHTPEAAGWGSPNLLGVTWTELISDDSDYFIDGVLRIRACLTLKSS